MKKVFAFLLALAMLLSVSAGCGSTGSSVERSTSEEQSSTSVGEQGMTDELELSEVPAESSPELAEGSNAEAEPTRSPVYEEVSLPITTDDVTLTLWYTTPPMLYDFIADLSELYVYNVLTERTGVKFAFDEVSIFTAAEKFGLMIASQDYTDILVNSTTNFASYGGLDWAVNEDIIVPLNDKLDMAPAYAQLMHDSGYEKDFYTDSGNLCGFYQVAENDPLVSNGYLIRQDFLDGLGLDIPITFDQVEDTLTQIVNNYDVEMGIYINEYGGGPSEGLGISVFNPLGEAVFSQTDGKVRLGIYDDSLRTYLEYMSRWYEKGIIYSDYYSLHYTQGDAETKMMSGACAMSAGDYDRLHVYREASDNPDYRLVGALAPVLEEGEINHLAQDEAYVNTSMSWLITTGCEDAEVETAIKLCNYFYTDEGSLLLNYGTEGYTFEYEDEDKPVLTDLVVHNPNGIAMNFALSIYVIQSGPMRKDFDRQYVDLQEGEEETLRYWTDNQSRDGNLPTSLSLTVDESSKYSSIMSDVLVYALESINRFITGELNLEDDFDNYMSTMQSMGVEDAIAIYQAALDRYNDR